MTNGGNMWTGLIVGAVKVAVVAFVVLNLKELRDAGNFDFAGTSVDAGLIGGAPLLLNAVLNLLKGRRASAGDALARGGNR